MAIVKCCSFMERIGKLYEFGLLFAANISNPIVVCRRYYLLLNSLRENLFLRSKPFMGKWPSVTKVAVDNKCLTYLYTINKCFGWLYKETVIVKGDGFLF